MYNKMIYSFVHFCQFSAISDRFISRSTKNPQDSRLGRSSDLLADQLSQVYTIL
jgi:hypothetical protein